MSNEADKEGKPLAAPMVAKREPKEQSLDLENVDMSKDGIQGDVLVSKGRSSTFVTKLRKPKDG
jgi:hypothetical protein